MSEPEHRPYIPPAGPTLSFGRWAQIVHRTIKEYMDDKDDNVTAAGTGKGVTITYQPPLEPNASLTLGELANAATRTRIVRITPDGSTWYVTFERGTSSFSMAPLAIDRHDSFTARVAAETIAVFLHPKLCKVDKKPRVPTHEPT